jgi:hypothetical protein
VSYPRSEWFYWAGPWYSDINEVVHPGGEPWDVDAEEAIHGEPWGAEPTIDLDSLWDWTVRMAEEIALDSLPPPPPRPFYPASFVGWSQPPRPVDVVVSFNPNASKRDQARSVLYDYYHDDPLRYWADNDAVKRCFKAKTKEDHDPLKLIAAYENKSDPVWKCQGTGMHWADMDKAVQQAIAHRKKLGPLPKSSYDTNPLVIYYYDNDKMKRITYPSPSIPNALNPHNNRWWTWGMGDSSDAGKDAGADDIHTRETDDPKKIAVERQNPGWTNKAKKQALKAKYPWISDMGSGSAGDWGNEQFTWDKDVAGTGVIGSITGAILAVVSAVLDATGIGAVIGVPLGIATPFIVQAINLTDQALHQGDFGAALTNLGPAIMQAAVQAAAKGAGAAGINLPPAALQALGTTVTAIGKAVQAGQQKKQDFAEIWSDVASRARSFGKIGDDQALTIANVLSGGQGGPATANVFIEGFLAGKFLEKKDIAGIAKILQAYATFADPRIINIALLGIGMGMVSKGQGNSTAVSGGFATQGELAGQVIIKGRQGALDDLDTFVQGVLVPRQFDRFAVGLECPPGFDLVATDSQIACAFRGKAACLAGQADPSGNFVCTDRDFTCPPGMATRRGSPSNWCFPQGSAHVGGPQEGAPDWSFPALGCPHGYWRDDLSGGVCRPITPMPTPRSS